MRLNSDKLQLEQEVAVLKAHLNKETQQQVKPSKQSSEIKQETSPSCSATQKV